jgi:ribonuclease BN (tRNA processing enzyme)
MSAQVSVLASGSRGNAALIATESFGVLIDCGLPPKTLSERLAASGHAWPNIHAVVLTHTHTDHWNRSTLSHLHRYRIPLFLHAAHHESLQELSPEYGKLVQAKLVRLYQDATPFGLGDTLACTPLCVPHDSYPTFAFRIDCHTPDGVWSIGYASDLGEPPPQLHELFRHVDLLAIEFNHDVPMQKASGRSSFLINRVLGKNGHLSNEQAAQWMQQHLQHDGNRLRTLIQLHLSRDCNTPALAVAAIEPILQSAPAVRLITAQQDIPSPVVLLAAQPRSATKPRPSVSSRVAFQSRLPGCE